MNAITRLRPGVLGQLALAAVDQCLSPQTDADRHAWSPGLLAQLVAAHRRRPGPDDERLLALAEALGLSDAELLTVALCAQADRCPQSARAVAQAQAPLGGARPLLGLAARAFGDVGGDVLDLAAGPAAISGLLVVGDEPIALSERSLSIPLAVLAALGGLSLIHI